MVWSERPGVFLVDLALGRMQFAADSEINPVWMEPGEKHDSEREEEDVGAFPSYSLQWRIIEKGTNAEMCNWVGGSGCTSLTPCMCVQQCYRQRCSCLYAHHWGLWRPHHYSLKWWKCWIHVLAAINVGSAWPFLCLTLRFMWRNAPLFVSIQQANSGAFS